MEVASAWRMATPSVIAPMLRDFCPVRFPLTVCHPPIAIRKPRAGEEQTRETASGGRVR